MTALFDHHIHTDRSDGRVSLEDRARSVAIRPHGVSDHYPWRDKMRGEDDVLRYIDDAARLGLRVGLEFDLGVMPPLRAATRASLHYLIGAVHQLTIDGKRVAFDEAGRYLKGDRAAPFAQRDLYASPDLRRKILESMLEAVRHGIDEVGMDIVGHPTFLPLVALGDPEEMLPAEWQERFIEMCVRSRVAIELNESYRVPHREFLVRARERGALFSVGSDTHGKIGPLDRTEAMIREAALDRGAFLSGARVRRESSRI
ncbi:MAG: hypothetical protein HYX56_02385 [Chloroflexi bacterium]|nr:hypothetical protein [Chloroflexota bacterium]